MSLDRADVERLYRTHGHIVLRRAGVLLGNDADAQEALQEVFAALLRSPAELRRAGSAVAWLYGATTHLCLNLLRKRRNGVRLSSRDPTPALAQAAHPRADALVEVRSLLALLPEEVGAAVVYHHLDGMTYDEVADQLGCSVRKVGHLLERAHALVESERAEQSA